MNWSTEAAVFFKEKKSNIRLSSRPVLCEVKLCLVEGAMWKFGCIQKERWGAVEATVCPFLWYVFFFPACTVSHDYCFVYLHFNTVQGILPRSLFENGLSEAAWRDWVLIMFSLHLQSKNTCWIISFEQILRGPSLELIKKKKTVEHLRQRYLSD